MNMGSTKGALKKGHYNQRNSFAYEIYMHRTSLSNSAWEIKNNLKDPILEWYMIKQCRKYKVG